MNVQSPSVPVSEAETSKTTDQLWNLLQNEHARDHKEQMRDSREAMITDRTEISNEPKGFHFARRHIQMNSNIEHQYGRPNHSLHGNFQSHHGHQNQVSQPQSPQYFQPQSAGFRGAKTQVSHFMPPATHHTWCPGDLTSIYQSSMLHTGRNRKFSQSQEINRENTSPSSLASSRPSEGHHQFTEGYQSSERRNSFKYENINISTSSQGHNKNSIDSHSGFHFGASSGFSPNRPEMSTIATQTEPVHCIPFRSSSINSISVSQQQINQSHSSADYHMTPNSQRTRHYSNDHVFENMKNRPTEMISLLSPSQQYHNHQQSNCQQPQMSPLSPCHSVQSPSSNHCQPKFVFEQVDTRSPQCNSEPRSPPNKLRILLENGHHFAKNRVIQQPVESSVQYDPPPMRKFAGSYDSGCTHQAVKG